MISRFHVLEGAVTFRLGLPLQHQLLLSSELQHRSLPLEPPHDIWGQRRPLFHHFPLNNCQQLKKLYFRCFWGRPLFRHFPLNNCQQLKKLYFHCYWGWESRGSNCVISRWHPHLFTTQNRNLVQVVTSNAKYVVTECDYQIQKKMLDLPFSMASKIGSS